MSTEPDPNDAALSAADLAPLAPAQTFLRTELASLGWSPERIDWSVNLGLEAASALLRMRAPMETAEAALYAPAELASEQRLELGRRRHGEQGHGEQGEHSEQVSKDIESILSGVVRLSTVNWARIDESAAETLRNLFLAMAQDIRVVLVALAVRLAELRMLQSDTSEAHAKRRIELAKETTEIFAPLANRLGVWQFKWELEDLSLSILEPESYQTILRLLSERGERREELIQQVQSALYQRLTREHVPFQISGRKKHIASIYKKMQQKQVSFDEIYDISAVRVVTDEVAHCYLVLGIVHELWTPIPGEFDDYIAMPKGNGYQSLHTAVIGPGGRAVEIQIRTEHMHRFAELGVAAHWAYKERRAASAADNERLSLLRRLLDWERDIADPEQFVDSLKASLFEDQVFVFTPQGDVIDLPKGSTPVDFAYRVHTQVGHRCKGARVNGQIVGLDTVLTTGDRVEILTQRLPKPNRDWMNAALGFAKSAGTRAKVRHWFREQSRETAIAEGREMLERELARVEHRVAGKDHAVGMDRIAKTLGYDTALDLFAAVGRGDKRAQTVVAMALDLATPPQRPPAPIPGEHSQRETPTPGLTLDGISDVLAKRGACCKPVPGDDVLGFVTRGRGVVIHRRDCSQMRATQEPERVVEVRWHSDKKSPLAVEIEVKTGDSADTLSNLTAKIASFGTPVVSARRMHQEEGVAAWRLSVECVDSHQVAHLLSRLARDSAVLDVRRVRG